MAAICHTLVDLLVSFNYQAPKAFYSNQDKSAEYVVV